MEIPELPYTIPRVVKGRNINKVPAGSTMEKEVAKQSWYVEFFFHNPAEERMERIRVTRKLNRIKDPRQKLRNFNNLCEAYRIALEGGWNPLDEHANARLKKEIIGIDLNEALVLFESYHKAKGTRLKSIGTYRSTLNSFLKYHGGNKKVNTISDFEITDFLNFKEREEKWAGVTYNNCRIGLNNLFRYLKVNKYISENPVTDCDTRKKMPIESHQVFTERDFKVIMDWLDKNDKYPYMYMMVRSSAERMSESITRTKPLPGRVKPGEVIGVNGKTGFLAFSEPVSDVPVNKWIHFKMENKVYQVQPHIR